MEHCLAWHLPPAGADLVLVEYAVNFDQADEDAASKVDAIVAELEPKMKGQKGFVKVTRAVCKSEWAYEAALVFDNIDNFKAYMGSEFREKEALPYLEKISAHATDKAAIYSGNRVYDEY